MFNENDDYSDEYDEYDDIPESLIQERLFEKQMNIIFFYKELLMKESEFIGIKNISTFKILDIIQNTTTYSLNVLNDRLFNKNILTCDQIEIFKNMYSELNIEDSSDKIFNIVADNICNRVYI